METWLGEGCAGGTAFFFCDRMDAKRTLGNRMAFIK